MVAHHPTNRIKDQFQDVLERPTELVKEHPLPAMLLMFGLGMGVGVLVGQTVCSSLLDMFEEPTLTDRVRQQVYDALSNVVSPSVMRQIQNYTS
jgi:hypothetical protein